MDYQALRVAHVREQAVQLETVYEALSRLQASIDTEAQDRSAHPLPMVPAGEVVGRMIGETRVVDPVHPRVVLQELRNRLGVLRVTLHPQGQRLEALQEEEAVEGTQGRTVVAQHLDASFEYVCKLAQSR